MSKKRLMPEPRWQPDDEAAANVRSVLPAMARQYFAVGRKLVAAQADAEDLHPFRLATKRFRYTLEVFRDLYGSSMEKRLAMLKPLQQALGDVNDCVATREDFDEGKKFEQFLDRRAAKKAREFYRAWTNGFDAPGQEANWVRYLSRVPQQSRQAQSTVDGQDLTGHEVRTS